MFGISEAIGSGEALNRRFPTFDTCDVKLLGLTALSVFGFIRPQ